MNVEKLLETSSRVIYDTKIIRCGDYIQVYQFENTRSVQNNRDLEKPIDIHQIDTDNLCKLDRVGEVKSIALSNAIRSKLNCQRIAKSNSDVWESFITLTFADTDKMDITNISECNSKFNDWISNIRKLKPDFMYEAVPEFQKLRGEKYGIEAVHYHVLSNLGKNDIPNIIIPQTKWTDIQLQKMTEEQRSSCFDVKYWNRGLVQVDFCKSDYKKIYGYISKYMTKDIDNKLFGKKRYFYSRNLVKPVTEYLDLSNPRDYEYYQSIISNKAIDYSGTYKDTFYDKDINYYEFL